MSRKVPEGAGNRLRGCGFSSFSDAAAAGRYAFIVFRKVPELVLVALESEVDTASAFPDVFSMPYASSCCVPGCAPGGWCSSLFGTRPPGARGGIRTGQRIPR